MIITMYFFGAVTYISLFVAFTFPLVKGMRLIFEISEGDRMCFHENLNSSSKYVFEYQVTAGGSYDIDVAVGDPSKRPVFKQEKSSYGTLYLMQQGKKSNVPDITGTSSVEHNGGRYSFCFSNKFSLVTHKRVYFGLLNDADLVLPVPGVKDAAEVASLTQLEYSMSSISSHLSTVENQQVYFQTREARHRSFAKELNSNVSFYSIIFAVAILIVSFGQVILLRSFFTEKAGQRSMKVPT